MLYLIDADVLIRAKNEYYEFSRVPEYWEWLAYQGEIGRMKLPVEIYEEITRGKDELADWSKSHKTDIVLNEEVNIKLLQKVVAEGYAPDLTDTEVETMGSDPFLIAYALFDPENRIVVTREVRNNQVRQNRKVPNVCDNFEIVSIDPFDFGRRLDFRTNWKRP